MNREFRICLTTPMQMHFFGSFLQVFRQAGPPQRLDCLSQWELGVNCLFQGHDNTLLMQELNQGSVIFRLLARRLTTELLSPLNSAFNLN